MDSAELPTRTAAWKSVTASWIAYAERFIGMLRNLQPLLPLYVGIHRRILYCAKQVYLNMERCKLFLKTADLERENKVAIARLGEITFNHRDTQGMVETLPYAIISQQIRNILDYQKKLSHTRNPPIF